MKKTNSNIILVISALIFIMLIILCVYFYKVIGNKNRHISAVISTLENKMKEKEGINALNARMIELNEMNKKVGNYLANTSQIDTFVEYLEGMGVSNDVELSVKSVEIPKNEKNKIALTIDTKGSFQNILKVIALLENAPYNISITSLYFSKDLSSFLEDNNADTLSDNKTDKTKEIIVPPKLLWQASLSFTVVSI